MKIGVPAEIKTQEYRVGLTPAGVMELAQHGHDVMVQRGAGKGAGFSDDSYVAAGARMGATASDVFAHAELIVKVKEPQPSEWLLLQPQHILFTYLHLAASRVLTDALIASGATCIAYETVTDAQGRLPLLAPMSEVAGRMSVQAGARFLEAPQGGRGVLLGGVAGVMPARVLVLGAGVVGLNAARMAMGLGAQVSVIDKSLARLQAIDEQFGGRIHTQYSTRQALIDALPQTDLLIGAVLIPGASAPRLVTRELLALMRPGSVFVDVAIDQGGCSETSRATTHDKPVYVEAGVLHYCVANIPGAVPFTSTQALTHATLPYVLALANSGVRTALQNNAGLRAGANVMRGQLCNEAVAQSFGMPAVAVTSLLV
jgi:alanine dehydrogenase